MNYWGVRYQNHKMAKRVEQIKFNQQDNLPAYANWSPTIGEETDSLLEYYKEHKGLDDKATERIKEETVRILSMCGNPNNEYNNDTGIIVGYVQSGKTMSFTTLSALAKDNNYQLVIVIAGLSNNLVKQSTERLNKDLRVEERRGEKWRLFQEPSTGQSSSIQSILDEWKDKEIPQDMKRSVLITVKKNTTRLKNLINLMKKLNLEGVPTLIIDDEGDQASLNTKARAIARGKISENEYSAIYNRIITLKSIIPNHVFLQYTATPQAPLFINIMDILSPNFIQLLTPGERYTGGKEFFIEDNRIVKEIPADEIYSEDNPIRTPPKSLLEALRIFFLEVTLGTLKFINSRNISMMIHPSHLTDKHNIYYRWASSIKQQWKQILDQNDTDPDKIQLIKEFEESYWDIQTTSPDIPDFSELEISRLKMCINRTEIIEVNSRTKQSSAVNWNENYSFILVGGQAMDRGFTVEGLTVTYMPRGIGVGNVDTVQQRARFFGYKRDYLNFCRVYLDFETKYAYEEIVEHEEDIRMRLEAHKLTGKHLNEMDRTAILDELLNLTRRNVISDEITRTRFGGEWYRIKAPHDSDEIIKRNFEVIVDFKETLKLEPDEGDEKRTIEQIHLVGDTSLKRLYQNLLKKLVFTRLSDSTDFTNLKIIIKSIIDEKPDEDCKIYFMKQDNSRDRRLNQKNEIQQLFQGKNPKSGKVIYPGDEKIKDEDKVTVQIHKLDIHSADGKKRLFKDVYTLAVWLPESFGRDFVRLVKDEKTN